MIPIRESANSNDKEIHLNESSGVIERSIYDISLEEALSNDDPEDTLYSANSVTDLLRWMHGE